MERLFNPESVVIAGASTSEDNLARFILLNLVSFGFKGAIYLLGRRKGYLMGHPIRTDVSELPEGIDVACLLIPAPAVFDRVKSLHERGVKRFIIYTGGFSEYGDEGKRMEKAIEEYAKKHGLLIVGPNCLGIMNFNTGFVAPFVALSPETFKPGGVAVVAQSGGVATGYASALAEEGIGLSKVVSIGNKMILNESHYIDFLSRDPETKVILVYLESIKDGRGFFEALQKCPKPVVVHKANVTEASRRIAQFHTASLASKEEIVSAAIKQAKKLRVHTTDELILAAKALQLPPLKGKNLAIVSRSGGEGVILADAAGLNGFNLPDYPEEITSFVLSKSRARVIRPTNPLDLGDVFDILSYADIVEKIAQNELFHGIVFASPFFHHEWEQAEMLLKRLSEITRKYNKPITAYISGEREYVARLKSKKIHPIFNSPEAAVRAQKVLFMLQ